MHFILTVAVSLSLLTTEVVGRQMTVANNCTYTIWYVLDIVIRSPSSWPMSSCAHPRPPRPGLYTDPSDPSKPTQATGSVIPPNPLSYRDGDHADILLAVAYSWQQDAHKTVSFSAPNDWKSDCIWGRTGCDFSKNAPGPNQCVTGGCNGGLKCDPKTGTVRPDPRWRSRYFMADCLLTAGSQVGRSPGDPR